jgi:threonine dehydrogenase-like Zn-dependent dehydrogenase
LSIVVPRATGTAFGLGSDASSVRVGTPVAADINVGCGRCFHCRKNEELLCSQISQIGIHRNGAFAEYVLVPERLIVPIPEDMPFEIAALTEPLSCCIRSFTRSNVKAGASVLILGTGPIGNLHVQMARLVGAAPIIAVDLNPARAEAAKAVGADVVITSPDDVDRVVRQYTDGRGADVVIESVGSAKLSEQALQLVRPGGRVAALGVAGADARSQFAPLHIVMKEIGMKGTVASSGDDFHQALTLLKYDRIKTDCFTYVVRNLEDSQRAIEEFMSDPKISKIQIVLER